MYKYRFIKYLAVDNILCIYKKSYAFREGIAQFTRNRDVVIGNP